MKYLDTERQQLKDALQTAEATSAQLNAYTPRWFVYPENETEQQQFDRMRKSIQETI